VDQVREIHGTDPDQVDVAALLLATLDVVMASDWQVTVTVSAGRRVARATFTYLAHY